MICMVRGVQKYVQDAAGILVGPLQKLRWCRDDTQTQKVRLREGQSQREDIPIAPPDCNRVCPTKTSRPGHCGPHGR